MRRSVQSVTNSRSLTAIGEPSFLMARCGGVDFFCGRWRDASAMIGIIQASSESGIGNRESGIDSGWSSSGARIVLLLPGPRIPRYARNDRDSYHVLCTARFFQGPATIRASRMASGEIFFHRAKSSYFVARRRPQHLGERRYGGNAM